MSENMIKELDAEILTISNSLECLNERLNNDFEEYVLKNCDTRGNECTIKKSEDLINSFSGLERTSSVQKLICNLNCDVKSLFEKLETSVDTYLFVQKILALDQCLKSVSQHMETDSYKAAEHLIRAKRILDECSRLGRFLDFYKRKNEDYYKLFTTISFNSLEKWNCLVCLQVTDSDNKEKYSAISVSADSELLKSVYQTLELIKVPYKETFCEKFLAEFLKPIVTYKCKLTQETNVNGFSSLVVSYSVKPSEISFAEVLENLVEVFEFINFFLELTHHNTNSFIPSIGSLAADNFLKIFLEKYLFRRIPLKRTNLDDYKKNIEEMDRLLTVMFKKGFIRENNALINEYCCNAEDVFERKVGLRYKQEAYSLLKLDLQDMLVIESKSLMYPMPNIDQAVLPAEEAESDFWITFVCLLNNDNRKRSFLQCQVSKSVVKFVDHIKDCLTEASSSSEVLKKKLYSTSQEMIQEYLKLPEIHRKLIDIIPQQSALVFTNSFFLIMSLVHLCKEFQSEHFNDFFNRLQKMAIAELYKQIRSQEEIAITSLEKAGLEDISKLEVFPKMAEKVVRQCLRQAMLLKTVWMDVLPQDIYCIVIGRFIDTFIDGLIRLILSASDIREDIANNLVRLFDIINEKAPQVLPESKEVHRFVKYWSKLGELRLVLAGSLADINERWAGGRGPLAHELEAFQVRALIIALFQSSDIRQRTLASIR